MRAASIRERRLFLSALVQAERKKSEHKHKDSVLVLLESGVRGHHQVLSGVRVDIDGRLGSSLAEPASSA